MGKIICLTGFMGVGKTSVGKELSKLLGCQFIDLDRYIEKKSGMSVPEIFSSIGEKSFRDLEYESLKELLTPESDFVLALGGGTILSDRCAELINEFTHCFYLKASVGTLVANLKGAYQERPLLKGKDIEKTVSSMLAERESLYYRYCDNVVVVDGLSMRKIAGDIIELIKY